MTACRLLTKAIVRAVLAEREREIADRLQVTRERVIEEVRAAIGLAQQQGNPAAMIAGWREIARMCGYYAPERKRVELSGEASEVMASLQRLTNAELLRIAVGEDVEARV